MLGRILKGRRQVRTRKRRHSFVLQQGWSLQGCGGGSPEYEVPFKRKIQNLLIHSFIYSFFHPSIHPSFLFFFNFKNFVYLFLAVLGLCCCTGSSLVMEPRRGGLLSGCNVRLLLLQSTGLGCAGTQALERSLDTCSAQLSCSEARGIFLEQGSNPCHLHRWANSLPLSHEGSSSFHLLRMHSILQTFAGTGNSEQLKKFSVLMEPTFC